MFKAWSSELIGFQAKLLLSELAYALAIPRTPAIPRVLCLIVVLAIIIHVSTEATHYFVDKISLFEFLSLHFNRLLLLNFY
jgi:hypothetical protein